MFSTRKQPFPCYERLVGFDRYDKLPSNNRRLGLSCDYYDDCHEPSFDTLHKNGTFAIKRRIEICMVHSLPIENVEVPF